MFNDTKVAFVNKSDWALKRAYWLFQLIENPLLTKVSTALFNIPFITDLPPVKWMIKQTIFKQFVAGESTQEALKVASELSKYKVGSILDYSVEGQTENEDFDEVTEVMLGLIDIAKQTEEIPFVVFKPTGLGRINLFEKVQLNQDLNESETKDWNYVKKRFKRICQKAYNEDVTLMVDAEESWMQTAADNLVTKFMREFNKERCVICNTLQMYRHDRLEYLKSIYAIAEQEDFQIGFKLVRGAYMEKERERAEENNYPSPIQPNKAASDRDYNAALEFIVERHHRISLFAGTHNEQSCELLLQLIKKQGLAKKYHKIWFGQLLGMSDNISFKLADMGYNVAKYLPYGPIKDVMPYLIRRAKENTSVQGQSGRELNLIKKEIQRRKNA